MKRYLLIFVAVAAVAFMGCSKDDSEKTGFSDDVRAVLSVMNGKFTCEKYIGDFLYSTQSMTFTNFKEPTPKLSSLSGVPTNFDGKIDYYSSAGTGVEFVFYYYVDAPNAKIIMWTADENRDDYFSVVVMYEYKYRIINNNKIELLDTSLTYPEWSEFIKK